jgi:hypothetical protein
MSANVGSTDSMDLGQTLGGTVPALTALGGSNGLVSIDAMQEFRIEASTYAPECGRTPGAQISIVTKCGGNQFHRTAYDYFRNDLFDWGVFLRLRESCWWRFWLISFIVIQPSWTHEQLGFLQTPLPAAISFIRTLTTGPWWMRSVSMRLPVLPGATRSF